jgi:hypothetical protein
MGVIEIWFFPGGVDDIPAPVFVQKIVKPYTDQRVIQRFKRKIPVSPRGSSRADNWGICNIRITATKPSKTAPTNQGQRRPPTDRRHNSMTARRDKGRPRNKAPLLKVSIVARAIGISKIAYTVRRRSRPIKAMATRIGMILPR